MINRREKTRERSREKSGGFSGFRRPRRRNLKFFDHPLGVDYKNVQIIEQFITERGRIIPRRITGLSAYQQRQITLAVKRARVMALIPFSTNQQR